jgi:hypothetical protein
MSDELEQGREVDEASAPAAPAKRAPRKAAAKKAAPAKRVRRTKEQILEDELAALRKQLELVSLKLAVTEAEKSEAVETVKELKPAPAKLRVFHVVEDGLTALGQTWYRGQEIFIEAGSEDEQAATDRFGNFLFDLTDRQQMERFDGTVFWREGPWPGLGYDTKTLYVPGQVDESGRKIEASEQELAVLEKANAERIKKLKRAGYDVS